MIRSVDKQEISNRQAPQIGLNDFLDRDRLPKVSTSNTYDDYREMQKDATVALIREVAPGPILAANWSIEGESKKRVDLIKEDVLRLRNEFLLQAIKNLNDFGWIGFEKVWYKDEKGRARLKKLKPLLHDYTHILVDTHGNFKGFEQDNYSVEPKKIPLSKSLLLSQDVEGTNWYGRAKLENVSKVQDHWDDSNDGANRYDKKIAGSHWVVYYPIGETKVNGVMTDNYDLAGTILAALESSGVMRIPAAVQSHISDLNADGKSEWKIETISDTTARQHSFTNRLEYLDRLKCRAYGFPEDTILKTRYTPKTEQGVHANIVATAQDVQHQYIVYMLNQHVINQILRYNWGKKAENTVYVVPAPITNMSLTFLQDVYKMLLNNQNVSSHEYNHIDHAELRTKIAVPHDGESEPIDTNNPQTLNQPKKVVEDPTQEGSFKAEGVQN